MRDGHTNFITELGGGGTIVFTWSFWATSVAVAAVWYMFRTYLIYTADSRHHQASFTISITIYQFYVQCVCLMDIAASQLKR